LALGGVVSAFFAWIGFRGLDIDQFFEVLGQIDVLWLPLAALVFFVGAYLITWRWYYLLHPLKDIPLNRLYPIVIIGYMGNNIYPARIGELIRAYFLHRNEGIRYAPSLATILVERIFDGLVMLTFIFTALLFVDFDEPILETVFQALTPLFFGAMAFFFALALKPAWAEALYTRLIQLLVPSRLQAKVLEVAERFMAGLVALRNPRLLAATWFFSLASWTVEASTYWIVLRAFDFEVTFWALFLVMGLANLTTILPSTPGYVGTFHGVTILTLSAFGVTQADAGAYAIVMHMVLWLPITLVGFMLLWQQGLTWRGLDQATQTIQQQEASA
jgi:hypothetical protein